jgi:SPP1 gp7 family putative phage head morphogenesis protein
LTNYTKLIEKVAKQLHAGTLQPSDLNSNLLTTILNDVKGALVDGYGKDYFNYDTSAKSKLQLNQNLYRFSAAKTYQQLAKMNYFLGNKSSFADFKKEALKVNQEYNVQYLQTEFVTANRSGAMSQKWDKIQSQKQIYPNLTYKTANDGRVREEHRNLQGITKPIDDPFWDKWYPPNGWNCRCYVTQSDSDITPGTPDGNPTPGFHGNVGKSNMVFNENEHPYFVFPAQDAKKIKASFEDLKFSTPDYQTVFETKKAKLAVSTWADPNDIKNNYHYAKIIVEKLNIDFKIRSHVEIDGVKNPEYEAKSILSDLKVIDSEKRGIYNGFKSMKEKMKLNTNQYSIVFALDNVKKITLKNITDQLENKISVNRGKRIDSIFFVKGQNAIEITREMILKKDYKAIEKLL